MVGTMSSVDRVAMDLEKAPRLYRGWYLGGSEVVGSKASAQPPPCAYRSRSETSRPMKMSKDIKLVEVQSCGRIL